GSLFSNELLYVALFAARRADQVRIAKLNELTRQAAGPTARPERLHPVHRRGIAGALGRWAADLPSGHGLDAAETPEVRAVMTALAPEIRRIAELAERLWGDALEIEGRRAAG